MKCPLDKQNLVEPWTRGVHITLNTEASSTIVEEKKRLLCNCPGLTSEEVIQGKLKGNEKFLYMHLCVYKHTYIYI